MHLSSSLKPLLTTEAYAVFPNAIHVSPPASAPLLASFTMMIGIKMVSLVFKALLG